jgi:protein-disulfide isomerase
MSVLRVPVNSGDHIRGSPDAPVAVVEYGDYECPICALAHPVVKRVQEHFGKRLCFAYRHFPLTQVHPHAENAAETAEFAGAHGRFWEMHDALYQNQPNLGAPTFLALAAALGLPAEELGDVLATSSYAPKIRSDFIGGVRSGVNGTPTFFIAGQRYDGPPALAPLVDAIDAALVRTRAAV